MMNMNKLIRDQNVGTRFIASTSAHIEPAPGRDKSRPYMFITVPSSFKLGRTLCSMFAQIVATHLPVEQSMVMLSNQFGGEEAQQRHHNHRECYPIKTCIDGNAYYRTCQRQNRTQYHFIDRVWKEQDNQQTAGRAEKERFSPQCYAPISQ